MNSEQFYSLLVIYMSGHKADDYDDTDDDDDDDDDVFYSILF